MKIPRISLLGCMAVAIVVALDCFIVKAISNRPRFLNQDVWLVALLILPFLNVLAIVAGMRARMRGADRRFLVGFETTGWVVIVATLLGSNPLLQVVELAFVKFGLEEWVGHSETRTTLVVAVLLPSVVLVGQLIQATLGSCMLMRWLRRPPVDGFVQSDERPAGRRLAPLAWLVAIVAIPAIGTELYLRVTVDPLVVRFEPGSTAIVQTDLVFLSPSNPKLDALMSLKGRKVRVKSDIEPFMPEFFVIQNQSPKYRDHRSVQVAFLDGDRIEGATIHFPCYMLRVAD